MQGVYRAARARVAMNRVTNVVKASCAWGYAALDLDEDDALVVLFLAFASLVVLAIGKDALRLLSTYMLVYGILLH